MKILHTVLGANGTIGRETVNALLKQGFQIRVVDTTASKIENVEEILADLNNLEQTKKAIADSKVVYLTVGIPYKLSLWEKLWPAVMQNVIDACIEINAKLVFFDNVYCYGKTDKPMTEENLINPTSKKGEVRARLIDMILKANKEKGLTYAIARSADFYGPNAKNGAFNAMTFKPVAEGKTPSWFVNAEVKHSLTYTPDAGRAMAILGTNDLANNQTWHIPTATAMSGSEYIKLTGKIVGKEVKKTRILSKNMFKFLGFFVPMIRESVEMLYQNEVDYIFDSSKFEKTFGIKPTPYEEGIGKTINSMNKK